MALIPEDGLQRKLIFHGGPSPTRTMNKDETARNQTYSLLHCREEFVTDKAEMKKIRPRTMPWLYECCFCSTQGALFDHFMDTYRKPEHSQSQASQPSAPEAETLTEEPPTVLSLPVLREQDERFNDLFKRINPERFRETSDDSSDSAYEDEKKPQGNMDHLHMFCQHQQLRHTRHAFNKCIEKALQDLLFTIVGFLGTTATCEALGTLHANLRKIEIDSSERAAFFGLNRYQRRVNKSYTADHPTEPDSPIQSLVTAMQTRQKQEHPDGETRWRPQQLRVESGSHDDEQSNLVTKFFGLLPALSEESFPAPASACALDLAHKGIYPDAIGNWVESTITNFVSPPGRRCQEG
jgi:hypothetical protein